MVDYATIEVEPLTPRIGAVVHGLDLREPLTPPQRADVAAALARHLVLFWRDQDLTDDQHLAFAATFGAVNRSAYAPSGSVGTEAVLEWIEDGPDSPPKADLWHTDLAFLPEPPDVAVLNLLVAPPVGGDTLWVDLYGAYEALSPAMQEAVAGLELELRPATGTTVTRGEHREWVTYRPDPSRPGCRQPLTRVHPVTHRRALYLCGQFVVGVAGMTEEESAVLLALLRSKLEDPNLQCRWHWREGDLVVWDERCTNHRAVSDHFPHRRLVRRCTAGAAPPAGPAGYSSVAGSTPVPPASLLA
jgi:taurine dioxygenase